MSQIRYSQTGRFIDLIKENTECEANINRSSITINPNGKYINLSFEEFYNIGCNSAKYFYSQLSDIKLSNGRNVGLLSYSDSNYLFNIIGLMNVNAIPLLISPRNSIEAIIHLLKESNSHALIYQEYFNDVVDRIKTEIPNIKFIRRWSAEYPSSLAAEKYNVLLPLKSQTEELDATGYILHSSGSTSYPKLIPKSNKILHHNGNRLSLPENRSGLKDLVFYPLFHAAGHQEIFVPNIYYGKYTILPPDINPGSHYSTRMILSYIKELTPESLSLLPLIIKEIVEYCENAPHSEGWGILKSVKTIYHGGATLPELMSKALVEHQIVPHTTLGSTECGKYLKAYIDESQPDYTLLTPLNGVCYKLNSWGDDLVELIFLNSDPCLSLEKGLDEEGNFPTNDLYKIVGENPIQLKYVSRCDDTIVHVNGEKSNPIPMEEIINRCAFVDFSAVLGSGQQFNILLIQLKAEEVLKTPLSDVFASIMASVKLANESAPAHSRIYEEMIYYIPMKSEKNLPITMKGNLQRARCAKIFEKEVKSIVDKLDSGYNSDKSNESDENNSTGENLPSVVKSCLTSIIEKEIDTRQSFFNNGMDSLSGMRFRNLLKSKISGLELRVTDIYDNDTVEKLVEFIEFSKQGKKPNDKSLVDYQKEVDDYIARYSNLGLEKTSTKQLPTEDLHIAITGANGSLGSFMIKNLVEQSKVSKVYALIRAKDDAQAKQKLESSFSQRFININPENSSKIVPLAVKLHEGQLGLSNETYKSILPKLTHVHHVGWTMNFLKGLDYFDDCIAASKNLMKLSVLSQRKVIYNLVSTIGATFPTTSADVASVPETKLNTKLINAATCNGYNLSKLVTETVSQIWSVDYDIPVHIHRVGQISGDTINGAWNITEHFPLLVKGIQVMKICPDILESSVTWIPANTAADAIVEIGAQDQTSQNGIAHIINPLEYNWKIIYKALKSYRIEFEVVSIQEFIHQLKTNPEFQNVDINPLATLTDFFENAFSSGLDIRLETEITKKSSPSIANCPALDSDLMTKYLNFWTSQKFIR